MGNLTTSGAVKKQLYEVAFDRIYIKIISLEYKQGQVLYEKQLMRELGIGRTPIREALLRLVAGGIVESHPSKSFVVRSITLENIKAVFDALDFLEYGIASLAVAFSPADCLKAMADAQADVERAIRDRDILALVLSNYRFHMAFYEASRNEYFVYCLIRIRFETKRLAYLSYSQSFVDQGDSLRKHYDAVLREHRLMMQYLNDKDEKSLQQVCRAHSAAFRERIIRYLTAGNLSAAGGIKG